jgi:uncharacterized protein YecE (DUF72 family)
MGMPLGPDPGTTAPARSTSGRSSTALTSSSTTVSRLVIGTAGWSIPRAVRSRFPDAGSLLERYAARFRGVEINSTFYRAHRSSTYVRWAASVPSGFRFSVKMPKRITHELGLVGAAPELDAFLDEVRCLGDALGCVLVQLPPKREHDRRVANRFFRMLRKRYEGDVVIEPRNATWFTAEAEEMLVEHRISRVAADPACVPEAANPGGWGGIVYYRLHGSPRMYYSAYDRPYLGSMAARLAADAAHAPVWCIFDNTTLGAATENALDLSEDVVGPSRMDWNKP